MSPSKQLLLALSFLLLSANPASFVKGQEDVEEASFDPVLYKQGLGHRIMKKAKTDKEPGKSNAKSGKSSTSSPSSVASFVKGQDDAEEASFDSQGLRHRMMKKAGPKTVKGPGKSNEAKAGKSPMSSSRFSGFATAVPEQVVLDRPVVSNTMATMKYAFDESFTKMDFDICGSNGVNVTLVAFHCGTAGTNGPVAVEFMNEPNGANIEADCMSGSLEPGYVNEINCEGVHLSTIASLYQAIKNDSIYLNVQDFENPEGVVRGQLYM